MAKSVQSELAPPAATLPRGAVVLSLTGTERQELTQGVVWWTLLVGGGGFALGYWAGQKKRRRG
jgi:hypothetical protein